MNQQRHHARTLGIASGLCLAATAAAAVGADWLQFRGPNGASASVDKAPPSAWSADQNVAWTVKLPGRGVSSPIVVGGRVLVTSSSGEKQDRLHVLCFDAQTGKEQWSREFWATGRTLTHPFSAVAAPTPASDGERVFAFFSSNDLICLDLDGNLLWYRGLTFDYPKAGNDIGMASSPVVAGDAVVVQIENQGDSFAAGLDKRTGETLWRTPRSRFANWASPVAWPGERDGRHLVLLQSASGLTAHDAKTGEELWKYDLPCSTTPSLAIAQDRMFVPANGLTVLELPENATAPSLAWESNQLSPSPASPIVAGDFVYTMNNAGVLSCAEVSNGNRLWQARVGGRYWSTPVVAGSRMYCVNEEGQASVIDLSSRGKVIAQSEFGEPIKGSPAIADGALYVRGDSTLWKIASGS